MHLELDKIKQTAAYLAQKVPDLYFTKFLKLLYYFDFISVLERGRPATGDVYYHLPYGPVPSFTKDQLALLREQAQTEAREVAKDDTSIGIGSIQSIFQGVVSLEEKTGGFILQNIQAPNLSYLSQYEQDLLDDIIATFKTTPTADLVRRTHCEVPYVQTVPNDRIDYKLAFHLKRSEILPGRTYPFELEVSQAEYFSD